MFLLVTKNNSGASFSSPDGYVQIDGGSFFLSYDSRAQLFSYENTDGYCLCLIGKIFNLDELLTQKSLPVLGFKLQKIIQLKKIYGNELTSLLRGDFLLALLNTHTLELEFIKTPFSFKHLYYVESWGSLYLSSSLPLIRQALPYLCEIDKEKMIDSLSKAYSLSDRAFYKGILQLESAECVSWSPGQGLKKAVFWKAKDCSESRDFSSYTLGLKQHLMQAVERRISEENRACCEISGGLDSTSVAGVLAQKYQYLTGLSDYSDTDDVPELKLDREVTNARFLSDFELKYPNTQIVRFNGLTLEKNYSDISKFCFENSSGPEHAPNNMLWILSFYEYARQQGFHKIFSGRFGDMAFSFKDKMPLPWLLEQAKPTVKKIINIKRLWFYQPLLVTQKQAPFLLKADVLARLPISERELMCQRSGGLSKHRVAVLNFIRRYYSAASNLDNAILNKLGVEVLDPTSDLDLIEYCLTIPVEAYQNNGSLNRHVTREAMKGILPESVRLNKTKGIQGAHWYVPLKRELSYYKSLLSKFSKNDLINEVVDLERLKRLLLEFEQLPLEKLTNEHRFNLVHALHICEWIILHD